MDRKVEYAGMWIWLTRSLNRPLHQSRVIETKICRREITFSIRATMPNAPFLCLHAYFISPRVPDKLFPRVSVYLPSKQTNFHQLFWRKDKRRRSVKSLPRRPPPVPRLGRDQTLRHRLLPFVIEAALKSWIHLTNITPNHPICLQN